MTWIIVDIFMGLYLIGYIILMVGSDYLYILIIMPIIIIKLLILHTNKMTAT